MAITISLVASNETNYGSKLMNFLLSTISNKVYYCVKWKIDLIIQLKSMDEARPVAWTKIKVLQKYLPNYEWMVQMDAGILFFY